MNGKQVLKLIESRGFKLLRVSGSHHIMGDGKRKTAVPVHGATDLKTGTLKAIEKQSGVKLT